MFSISRWRAKRAWDRIAFEIDLRQTTLEKVIETSSEKLKSSLVRNESNPKRLLALAATDVFVEKAQRILTRRASFLVALGLLGSVVALTLLLGGAYQVFAKSLSALVDNGDIWRLNGIVLTLIVAKATAAGGLLIAACMFLMHLSKALFHEATILFNRRHALRFGRLFLYLKDGAISLKDLETAFKWNDEFSTAFKDINIGPVAPKTLVQSIVDAVSEAADKVSNAARGRSRTRNRTQSNQEPKAGE